jgi:alpha 1,2-mannosyltransferase
MAKSGMRVVRFVAIAVLLILAVYKLSNQQVDLSSYVASKKPSVVGTTGSSKEAVREPEKEVDTKPSGMGSGLTDQQPVSAAPYQRANATFVTLARNEDLHSLMLSIQGVEDRFNDKYHYSWYS